MVAEKAPKKPKAPPAEEPVKPLDPDQRFRYIGFDVYSAKSKEFFHSDEEKRQHEAKVKEYEKSHFSPLRSFTAVEQAQLTQVEKIILTVSSLGLVVAGFLPWLSFKSNWASHTFSGLLGFFQVSSYLGLLNLFNPSLKLFVFVPALLALLAFVFGLLTLLALYSGGKETAAYQVRLKRILSLQYIPLALWLVFFIVSIVGVRLPFGDWMAENYGLRAVGDTVNIVTFAALSGIGVWLSIAGLLLNAIKSNDL